MVSADANLQRNRQGFSMKYRIIVTGIGPGSPKYMVPAAMEAIQSAKVLVGGSRALSQFAHDGQAMMAIKADIGAVMEFISDKLTENDVVVMVSGDPGYYSLLDALRRNFDEDIITVIPGISSMQLAFSRLALPWHDADLISMHGREPAPEALAYREGRIIGFLTDGKNTSRTIPERLMAIGWPVDTKLAVCARLSYDDEEVIRTTLGQAKDVKEYTHCILVVH